MAKSKADKYVSVAATGALLILMGCLAEVATYFINQQQREIREKWLVVEGVVTDASLQKTRDSLNPRQWNTTYSTVVSFTTLAGEERSERIADKNDRRESIGETVFVTYDPDNSLGLRIGKPATEEFDAKGTMIFGIISGALILIGCLVFLYGYRAAERTRREALGG